MSVSLKHAKTSTVPDSGDPTLVQGSDWNSEHILTCASGVLLGRQTAGAGTAEEVPIADFWASPGAIGGTTPDAGTFTTLIGGKDAVNYQQIVGAAATKTPIHSVAGSDANIALALKSKGTGGIDLSAGSAGINISNGGTVTAITRTSGGSNYTTNPAVTISAPTTPGGTQATASCVLGLGVTPTIISGGTGYAVNDLLTISGGTFTTAAVIQVAAVSGGVITTVTNSNLGSYTVAPSGTLSVTGGTGTGATFTVSTWQITNTFTITNPGSGYLEQPQITFSGGGGSGAAAYATVGGGVTITTLGNSLSLQTPATYPTVIQIKDDTSAAASQTVFYAIGASSSLGRGAFRCNKALYLASGSSNPINFLTNSTATTEGSTQLAVTHTASAVNYVQVTGGATTVRPAFTAQGSDTNIGLSFSTKGSGNILFFQSGSTTAATNQTFQILNGGNANYLSVSPTNTGVGPALSAQGSDTNINLALTPKGTGTVQFGTYTASVLSPTGYITITDSGGTTRRLLVG